MLNYTCVQSKILLQLKIKQDIKEIVFKEQAEIEQFIQAQRWGQSPFFFKKQSVSVGELSADSCPVIFAQEVKLRD